MSRKVVASIAVLLGLFVIACGTGTTGGGQTIVPATSAPAAASGATSAPAADTAAPAAPKTAKVGDRVELNGMALTVVKVSRAAELGQFNKAKDGNEFVVAEVVIENVDKDKVPYNPLYFKAKDSEGFEVNAELVGGDQSLKSGELTKGDKARGTVAFEVKKDAKGLVLEYKPLVIGSPGAIKVNLE
jgi:hypothetical protein